VRWIWTGQSSSGKSPTLTGNRRVRADGTAGDVRMSPESPHPDVGRGLRVLNSGRFPPTPERLAFFLIRVSAGLFLALHGAQKLFGWFGGDRAAEIAAFSRLKLEPAQVFVVLTGTVELGAGILMMLGLLTRLAAAAAGGLLAMAAFMLRTQGFDWTKGVTSTPCSGA
jgi:uncharacterized membrane protein YphA (DoxX/SURF4 family)